MVPGGEIQSREHNDLLNLILETTAKEAASHQKCTSSTHIFQRRVERGWRDCTLVDDDALHFFTKAGAI